MVIVVRPSQSQRLLSAELNLSGTIATLPEFAFRREEQIAGAIASQIGNGRVDQLIGAGEPCRIVFKVTTAESKRFRVMSDGGRKGLDGSRVVMQ